MRSSEMELSNKPWLDQKRTITINDNSLILHIYIIIRKHYHTYFELINAFYSWFWNNTE